MNIRVVRTSGEPVTFWFAFLREVVIKSLLFGVISSFTAGIASLLDILWPLWDEETARCTTSSSARGSSRTKAAPAPPGRPR